MKNKLNDDIIATIKSRLSEDEQIVPFLMGLLCLGKESIYRRLRGEVAFTFGEVATISSKMGFSVDKLVGLKKSERVLFDADLHRRFSKEEVYYQKLLQYVSFLGEARKSKVVVNRFAKNYIPYTFSLHFDMLTKFRYYKWIHQISGIDPNLLMADLVVPAKIEELRKEWVSVSDRSMMHVTYILDNNMFVAMCRDIGYFYKSGLVNNREVELLQKELIMLIDHLEKLARMGVSQTGAQIQFYLLPFDLGATYSHIEFDNHVACHIQIHSIDVLQSFNPHVCEVQKNWIDSLKRYSVLITQSGEMQRLEYFKKQREYIMGIGQRY